MKIPEGLSCSVTPEQAYPGGVPDIPEGWEFVRFGKVVHGNAWLSSPEGHPVESGNGTTLPSGPRIIVRRKKLVVAAKPKQPATQEETDIVHHAARLLGVLRRDQILSVSEFEFFLVRLRAKDRASELAAELLPVYGPPPAEEAPKDKPAKPRRWLVEFPDVSEEQTLLPGMCAYIAEIVREVKPITREQVTQALATIYCIAMERVKYVNFLRNLGIEVEG